MIVAADPNDPGSVAAPGADAVPEEANGESIQNIDVEKLILDPANPRLPEEMQGKTQSELLTYLQDEEVLDELARSMLENGFFPHEPLIVTALEDEEDQYVVLEGNRRLAALTILLQLPTALEASLEFVFENRPTELDLEGLRSIPCFVVPNRDAVRKFLGFRHIGGPKTWSPEAKARYLEEEVSRAVRDGIHNPFWHVARRVGSSKPAVRGQYLALRLLRHAYENGIDASYVMKERFGVWQRLLNSRNVRDYVSLTGPMDTHVDVANSIEGVDLGHLRLVLADLTPSVTGGKAVLWDSRDVTIYGAVLANPRALQTLREFEDLSIARAVVERGSLAARLTQLTHRSQSILEDIDSFDIDQEAMAAMKRLYSATLNLRGALLARGEEPHD